MSSATPVFDVVIVGAGLVGTVCAHVLAAQGLRIAVCEQKKITSFDVFGALDARVSSINLASIAVLNRLGIWPSLMPERICAFQHMRVFEAYGSGQISFDAIDIGECELGFIVENNYLLSVLLEKLSTRDRVTLFEQTKAQSIVVSDDHVEFTYTTEQGAIEEKIQARLLIGADGPQSWVRQHLQMPVSRKSYQQSALITHIRTEHPHRHTAWQWFWPTGPLAFLPLPDPHMCSIVWSLPNDEATALKQHDAHTLAEKLEYASFRQLGTISVESDCHVYPLVKQSAQHYVRERIALIGDAAHTIHPLAGQGVNLGIRDALKLADVIHDAHKKQRDFGQSYILRRFERGCRPHNECVSTMMDGFHWLFANKQLALIVLRGLGLKLCDQSSLKLFFMRQAAGNTDHT